jgi:hypothetical protein
MMMTQARLDANRRNASKSAGPRTAHGKAMSRRNALKHGLCSENALMPGEDEDRFRELVDGLTAEFQPASPSRACLVDRLATSYWKLARIQRIENGIYAARSEQDEIVSVFRELRTRGKTPEHQPEPAPGSDEALADAYLRDSNGSRALVSLSHHEARLDRSFFQAYRELKKRTHLSPLIATNPGGAIASSSPDPGPAAPSDPEPAAPFTAPAPATAGRPRPSEMPKRR